MLVMCYYSALLKELFLFTLGSEVSNSFDAEVSNWYRSVLWPKCPNPVSGTVACSGLALKAQIPLRRLPRHFPVRESFGEVGVMEFGLYKARSIVNGWL